VAILDRADAGSITFLDASDMYPIGGNLDTVGCTEEILGRWLHGRRQDFVVAGKRFGAMSARPWDQGLSRKHILHAHERELETVEGPDDRHAGPRRGHDALHGWTRDHRGGPVVDLVSPGRPPRRRSPARR
jgi:hypothetical protein